MKSKKRVRNPDGPRHVTPAGRSVFFDLFEAEEAMELEVRATLLRGLEQWLEDSGMTQTEAAKALGVTQARISEIKRGKISRFSIDLLFSPRCQSGVAPPSEDCRVARSLPTESIANRVSRCPRKPCVCCRRFSRSWRDGRPSRFVLSPPETTQISRKKALDE